MFLPTLSSYETEKGVDNSLLKHKILTFTGTEEKAQNIPNGTNYSTRFIFECEGGKYYYEIKICGWRRSPKRLPVPASTDWFI